MERKLRTLFVTIYTPLRTNTGGHQRTSIIYNFLKENTDLDTLFLNVSHETSINNDKFFSYDININPSLWERLKSNINVFSIYFITPKHKKCSEIYKQITSRTKYDLIYFRFMATAIKCGVEDFSNVIIDVDDAPWQVHKSLSNSHVSSTNSKQSELCVNSSCNIDTRLLRKATICSNCTQQVYDKIIKAPVS